MFGSRDRRITAAFQLYFYTFIGSIPMLIASMYLSNIAGSDALHIIKDLQLDVDIQNLCWLCFFFSVAIKTPLLPFHIWLPEAHREAPTVGSVILAALVLKMGGFLILRILLPIFPLASVKFSSYVSVLCILGMIYCGFSIFRETDLKRIVAYSSIVHMSYTTLGFFTFQLSGISGATLGMFAHGLISAGMFFAVGMVYSRYGTLNLAELSQIYSLTRYLGVAMFILFLANIGLPGTANFPSELAVFLSCAITNFYVTYFLAIGIFINGVYNIWLASKLLYGPTSKLQGIEDVSEGETIVLYALIYSIFYIGLFPSKLTANYTFFFQHTLPFYNI